MSLSIRFLNYWSRLSLSYRGAAIVSIPAICLLATLGVWTWSRAEGLEIRKRIDVSDNRIEQYNELLVDVLNAETGVRGYLLSGDPVFLEPYQKYQKFLPETLKKLDRSIGDEREDLARLTAIKSRVKTMQTLLSEKLSTTTNDSRRVELLKRGRENMDALRQEINAAQLDEQASLDRNNAELTRLRRWVESWQQILTVAGILSTLGGIYLFWLLEQELRQRQSQLQTRDSTLDTLNANTSDGIAVIDRSGQIETVNDAMLDMFGYTAVDLLECPFTRLLEAATTPRSQPIPELFAWLEQRPKLGKIWQIEAYRQDGTTIPIELSLSEIPQEQQWIAIVRDVSEQANLMQQLHNHLAALEQLNLALVRANSNLERQNQELAEFAYVTAHDLKTPVRGISTLSEWIEEESQPFPSQLLQHYIRLLRKRTHRLNALIDGLWEYTNLGQTRVSPEPVELAPLLNQIRAASHLPPHFEIHLPPTDINLTTCKSHLRKVIEELIENSVKHHDRDRGEIHISVTPKEDKLEFIIRDDGPGIPAEYQQRVFRLFETLEPRDLTEHTGIGLAIAKKLVERVGGRIWLENAESNRGLCVHFTWPQQPPI